MACMLDIRGKRPANDRQGTRGFWGRGQGGEVADVPGGRAQSGVGGRKGASEKTARLGGTKVVEEGESDTGMVGLHDRRRSEGV